MVNVSIYTIHGSYGLCDHGWIRDDEWKWHHDLSGSRLDFTVLRPAGNRQHDVRQTWRAWCLEHHSQSSRRDRNLECFDNGVFKRIDWDAVRRFAASSPEARAIATGSAFSPAALRSAQNSELVDSCLWPGCRAMGTWEHICWTCQYRPVDVEFPPQPGEYLTSRFGRPVFGANVDIQHVHPWMTFVQSNVWDARHG